MDMIRQQRTESCFSRTLDFRNVLIYLYLIRPVLSGHRATSIRHRNFFDKLISISARSSLNVLRQILFGLPVFLQPPWGPTPPQYMLSDLLISVTYVQPGMDCVHQYAEVFSSTIGPSWAQGTYL